MYFQGRVGSERLYAHSSVTKRPDRVTNTVQTPPTTTPMLTSIERLIPSNLRYQSKTGYFVEMLAKRHPVSCSGQTLLYQPSTLYHVSQPLRRYRGVRLAEPTGKGTDASVSTSRYFAACINVIISFIGNLLIQPIVNGGTVSLNSTFSPF